MLFPSEFSHLRKRSAKKLHFCTVPGISCISENANKLQKLCGSAVSYLTLRRFLILVRVIAQEAFKALKWPSGCAHLLVHIWHHPYLWWSVRPPHVRIKWLLFGGHVCLCDMIHAFRNQRFHRVCLQKVYHNAPSQSQCNSHDCRQFLHAFNMLLEPEHLVIIRKQSLVASVQSELSNELPSDLDHGIVDRLSVTVDRASETFVRGITRKGKSTRQSLS